MAGTAFFANFGASGVVGAYALTGGVMLGATGYVAGFSGGMLYSDGNWKYANQSGMSGMLLGSTAGTILGGFASAGFEPPKPALPIPPSNPLPNPLDETSTASLSGGGYYSGKIWDFNKNGQLDKYEADMYWLYGGGKGISVNNAYIDWTGLKIPAGLSSGDIFSISTTDAFRILPYQTAATYGGTSFKVINSSQVQVLDQLYHYKYRSNNSVENIMRNFMNWYGKPNSEGTDFMIKYYNPIIQLR